MSIQDFDEDELSLIGSALETEVARMRQLNYEAKLIEPTAKILRQVETALREAEEEAYEAGRDNAADAQYSQMVEEG